MHHTLFKTSLGTDESEEGDFFYNEEEVLNGVGAENRAALLERYDAMLDDPEQPELEEVCLPPCHPNLAALDCNGEYCTVLKQTLQKVQHCKACIIYPSVGLVGSSGQ